MPACFLMKMKRHILTLVAALLLVMTSCKKGEKLPNVPPDTHISIEAINLTGDDRLRSEVTLHGYGADEDGWVTGYEISLNGTTWSPVNVQDSTFKFSLSLGSDTTDIDFFVRAIDNENELDPSPAHLLIPIKNTPPTAVFDSVQTLPDTSFIVTTLFLSVEDLDGEDNVDSIFVKFNGSNWFALSKSVRTLTIVPDDPTVSGAATAKAYSGAEAMLLPGTLNGLILDGDNVIYLKARDIAAGASLPSRS